MSDSKALAVTQADRNLDVVKRADERLRRKTAAIMDHQAAAADLDDNGVPVDPRVEMHEGRPVGWSPRKYNIARDSRKPEREQPGYLARATRVFESYRRGVEAEKPAPVMHVLVHVHASPAAKEKLASYRVIDVDADGEHS